jgi:hypothetical protein
MVLKRAALAALATALVLAIAGSGSAAVRSARPYTCSGKLGKPGILRGSYPNGVVVRGVCAVKNGKAEVFGTLLVTKGSSLGASFGLHKSVLWLSGNLVVSQGGIVFLGCKTNPNGSGQPCFDDPNMNHPTLTSHPLIDGNIIESSPIGVVIHNTSIGGSVTETGGGGGLSCGVPKTGPFAKAMSPIFSDLEDDTIVGNVRISALDTCWLGLARLHVRGSVTITNNDLGDPDGIEVLASKIRKNLACRGNTHPAAELALGAMPVWDSADLPPTFAVYPRVSEPNTVGGKRSGQCVTASPITKGGPPAAPAF